MIYPPATSFIPIQIALARFVEAGGPSASSGLYPYWYLGTTPYRYLTGPVLPLILASLHRIAGDWFSLMYLAIGVFWLLGGLGVYLLAKELGGSKKQAILSSFFHLFGFIVPLMFRFSDGLSLISFSLLPFVFLLYLKKSNWLLSLGVAFILLLDASVLGVMVLGLLVIFVTKGWKKAESRLKKLLGLALVGVGLATWWYTPGYWLTLLKSPSFGGKPLAGVIFWLGKLLPTAVALIAGSISVKFFKSKDRLRDFTFLWLVVFGLMTLLRFLSDPDFWLDWSAYGIELQFGLAILLGWWLGRKEIIWRLTSVCLCLLMFVVLFNRFVLGTFQKDINQAVEYRIGQRLTGLARLGDCVFLSGTAAFWLNAFFDIAQVRGGNDPASTDKNWRVIAWEIREGEDGEKSVELLHQHNISWLVVHTSESAEYWHDFNNPEKFEDVEGLEKVYDKTGDRIYRVLEED